MTEKSRKFFYPGTKNTHATLFPSQSGRGAGEDHRTGCMVCGAELVYFATLQEKTCTYCGRTLLADAACVNGHFVCNDCHRSDALAILRVVCLSCRETDCVTLMQTIRQHPAFHMHGPEHHSLVPAVILTALRNSGENISEDQILTAIQRGATIVGGSCAFNGICGAASGVGIAVSVLQGATPYTGDKRQLAMQATITALQKIASYDAARCCQRDSWLALSEAAKFLESEMGKQLQTHSIRCEQFAYNKECIHSRCPLWPAGQGNNGLR